MTQLQAVINQLEATGSVSRNWCLRKFNTRLSARILDLKKMGWKFAKPFKKDGDYIYSLVEKPSQATLIPKPPETPLISKPVTLFDTPKTNYSSHYDN